MKKLLIGLTLMSSFTTLAAPTSVDLVGTFENSDGCRVYGAMCHDVNDNNTCRFELYKDGEHVITFGKGGKVSSFDGETMNAKDFGLRSTMIGVPVPVNKKAKFTINESWNDPGSYSEQTILGFDIEVRQGVLNKVVIECSDLKPVVD
jgi:hypothetical protein